MDIEKIIRDYLPQIVHMSLATSKDNKPWVCEVHFVYDTDLNIYYRSLASRRHSQEIAANPHVAGNIIKQHRLDEMPVGIYFEGQAKQLTTDEERAKAFQYFKDRLQASEDIIEEAKRADEHQFYTINVSTFYVFGKFNTPSAQKYELKWGKIK